MHDFCLFTSGSSQITHCKEACNTESALHQLFFMNEAFFAMKEIVSSINIYALPKARLFLLFALPISRKWRKKATNVYRTGFINELLAMKYRRPIANHELNWKLKIVFSLRQVSSAILLCMEFHWVLPCFTNRRQNAHIKLQTFLIFFFFHAKCWNTNIFYLTCLWKWETKCKQ